MSSVDSPVAEMSAVVVTPPSIHNCEGEDCASGQRNCSGESSRCIFWIVDAFY